MTDEAIFIHCDACQAQVRLQASADNLEIRFCPKCGASVTPTRTEAKAPPSSAVKPLAPQR